MLRKTEPKPESKRICWWHNWRLFPGQMTTSSSRHFIKCFCACRFYWSLEDDGCWVEGVISQGEVACTVIDSWVKVSFVHGTDYV